MNPGRGWNHDLEESYLLEYIESEAKSFTQFSAQTFLWTVKNLASDPSPISRYIECTKTTSFRVFWSGVKLGFDFPRVLPNQKF